MLAWIAGGLLVGLLLGAFLGWSASPVALVPLTFGTLLFLVGARARGAPRRWVLAAATALALLAGLSLVPARSAPGSPGVHRIAGRVLRCDARACTVRLEALGNEAPVPIPPVLARLEGLTALDEGVTLEAEAELRPRAAFRNPSPHPSWPSLEPLAWTGRVRERTVARTPPSWLRALSIALRGRLRAGLERTLEEPTRGLALALVLGNEADVDEDTADRVRGVGLTHVLAVSGMHVTLVVGALLWLLSRLLRHDAIAARIDPARLAHAIAVPLALFYAELAGGSPSAWRAAVTAAIAWTLRAAGRRPDPIATSALAVLILASLDPASAARPAFVLSIASTAAVAELPSGTSLEQLARASLRASIATAPLTLWCFDGAPFVSVLANVLLLPIVAALVLPLATIHALIAALAPDLAAPSALLLDVSCRGFVGACDLLSAVSLGRDLPPLDAAEGIVVAVVSSVLVLARDARSRWIALCLGLLVFAGAEAALRERETIHGELRLTFLDVGQGDAAIVDLPDGRTMIVDTGGAFGESLDPGARVLVPLLRARRRGRVDVLVITHPHPDHYGGVAALAAGFPIDEVWDDGQASDEDPTGTWASTLRTFGARVRGPRDLCEAPREAGGAQIEVLWPCPAFDPGWDANDNSLVLRLRYAGRTLVLLGDAEAHAEQELLAHGLEGPVDLVKVGHHGSRTSSTPALIEALRPRLAVVSAGVSNRFGHPHGEVISRLEASGARVMRTDAMGGIVVHVDARGVSAESWSGERVTLP
ncbi:MAG: DNA internalization-related competence protein ComEC/Rec2 [Sandaracinus sp.]